MDWHLRPCGLPLVAPSDDSLLAELRALRTFGSVHTYLLSDYRACHVNAPPPAPPTLTTVHLADSDRHRSGLFAFSRDHTRPLLARDPDLPPALSGPDPADQLTDSESDGEGEGEGEGDGEDGFDSDLRPSVRKVRLALGRAAEDSGNSRGDSDAMCPPEQEQDAGGDGSVLLKSLPLGSAADDGSLFAFRLTEETRRPEQVELIRDRKILELEQNLRLQRDSWAERLTTRLVDISSAAASPLVAPPLQRPFHLFASSTFARLEAKDEALPLYPEVTVFVEQAPPGANSVLPSGTGVLGSPTGFATGTGPDGPVDAF